MIDRAGRRIESMYDAAVPFDERFRKRCVLAQTNVYDDGIASERSDDRAPTTRVIAVKLQRAGTPL